MKLAEEIDNKLSRLTKEMSKCVSIVAGDWGSRFPETINAEYQLFLGYMRQYFDLSGQLSGVQPSITNLNTSDTRVLGNLPKRVAEDIKRWDDNFQSNKGSMDRIFSGLVGKMHSLQRNTTK